jgi:hypothetical protein
LRQEPQQWERVSIQQVKSCNDNSLECKLQSIQSNQP